MSTKLNSLPDVQNNFKVELEKRLLNIKGRFGKDERRQIISTVCQVNRAIYDAKERLNKDQQIWICPLVDTGEYRVDPLRDRRVAKVLERVGTEHSCVGSLLFGQEGQKENCLGWPEGIATNSDGQFIVGDDRDKNIKVFESSGNFLLSFNTRINEIGKRATIFDLATDENNIYVLVSPNMHEREESEMEVKIFNSAAELLLKFPAGRQKWSSSGRLAVTKNKVLVLWDTENRPVVDVYDHDRAFVLRFDEYIYRHVTDITADDDGRIMTVSGRESCIHVFTNDGKQSSKFHINII